MSTYGGTDTYPATYTLPDDGDDVDAASVNVGFEALGDRTTYLSLRSVLGTYYWSVDTTGDYGAWTDHTQWVDSGMSELTIPATASQIVLVQAQIAVQNEAPTVITVGNKMRMVKRVGAVYTTVGIPALIATANGQLNIVSIHGFVGGDASGSFALQVQGWVEDAGDVLRHLRHMYISATVMTCGQTLLIP